MASNPSELTAAERAVLAVINAGSGCDPNADPCRQCITDARRAVAAVRPYLYREAAEYVRDVHVLGGARTAADVLERRADALARRDEETRDVA